MISTRHRLPPPLRSPPPGGTEALAPATQTPCLAMLLKTESVVSAPGSWREGHSWSLLPSAHPCCLRTQGKVASQVREGVWSWMALAKEERKPPLCVRPQMQDLGGDGLSRGPQLLGSCPKLKGQLWVQHKGDKLNPGRLQGSELPITRAGRSQAPHFVRRQILRHRHVLEMPTPPWGACHPLAV